MSNPFPPATGGVEINLSKEGGQGGNWSPNAQTSLTNSSDTNSGFKSMDYVPGHGGSYAAGGGAPGAAPAAAGSPPPPVEFSGAPPQQAGGGGLDLLGIGKKLVSAGLIIIIIGGLGFIGLSYLDQEGMSVEDLIGLILGTEEYDMEMELDEMPVPAHKRPKAKKKTAKPASRPQARPSAPVAQSKPQARPSAPVAQDDEVMIPENIEIGEMTPPEDVPDPFAPPPRVVPPPPELATQPLSPVTRQVPTSIGTEINIYSYIPASLPEIEPMSRIWSAQEEQVWRRGITNSYPWQRYKTVLEVKSSRLIQSRVILWDALEDSTFWTRMRAVMALAEFGVPVKKLNVQKAIGNARPELLANFVKRFIIKSSPGERYVLKHAIKMANPNGRINILKAFKNAGFQRESLDYYPVAALQDPSSRVRAYARSIVSQWNQGRLASLQNELVAFRSNPDVKDDELKVIMKETMPVRRDSSPIEVDDVRIYDDESDIDYDDVPDYDVEFDDF